MAILKVIAHGVRREAKRKVLQYVLDPKKTREDLCCVTGDYGAEQITPKTVFQEFQRTRKLFRKDRKGSRTYLHGTVSFAPGELPPEKVTEFAAELVEQIYPGHQVCCGNSIIRQWSDAAYQQARFGTGKEDLRKNVHRTGLVCCEKRTPCRRDTFCGWRVYRLGKE